MDGSQPGRTSRWHRYVQAAVQGTAEQGTTEQGGPAAAHPAAAPGATAAVGHLPSVPLQILRVRILSRLVPEERAADPAGESRRRVDLRLVPPALFVWAAAGAGPWLHPAWLLGLCCAVAAVAVLLAVTVVRRHRTGGCAGRSFLLTMAAAMLLSVAAAAHSAVSSAQKHDGPVAEAVAARASCLAEVEIAGAPRALNSQGGSDLSSRWSVDATVTSLSTGGRLLRAEARVVILGSAAWQHVLPGQRVRAAGKLRPPESGKAEAGILTASAAPMALVPADAWTSGPASLGKQFSAAAGWLDTDARGLLPGMVTGDTSGLDEQLELSMQTVGLTHLTAVSGVKDNLGGG